MNERATTFYILYKIIHRVATTKDAGKISEHARIMAGTTEKQIRNAPWHTFSCPSSEFPKINRQVNDLVVCFSEPYCLEFDSRAVKLKLVVKPSQISMILRFRINRKFLYYATHSCSVSTR